jgi:hypothetical protein
MRPLTLDDLLSLPEFAGRRRELFASLARYTDRYRRVRVGPRVALVFENRQTLWFRVQEILRVARLTDPEWIQAELDLYNRLLPGPGRLHASLLLDVPDETRWAEDLAAWATLRGEEVRLWLGPRSVPAELVTCRPEDRALGAAHWIVFALGDVERRLMVGRRYAAYVEVNHGEYRHESPPLSDEVRQSLLEDLMLSDRDVAAG